MKSNRRKTPMFILERRNVAPRICSILLLIVLMLWLTAAAVSSQPKGVSDLGITPEHANTIISAQGWLIVTLFGMVQVLFGFIAVYILKDINSKISKLFAQIALKVDKDDCVRCENRLRSLRLESASKRQFKTET